MRSRLLGRRIAAAAVVLFVAGCGSGQPGGTPSPPTRPPAQHAPAPAQPPGPTGPPTGADPGGQAVVVGGFGVASDPERVRAADFSILFVGNSHTMMHDIPGLVCRMIAFRRPEKTTYSHYVSVTFLEDAARSPACREEIESRPWKFVILQAQKISVSGKHEYSRREGIDLAKSAKGRGASVIFYPEWGLRGKDGDEARQEKVYREMARDAGAGLAPVARAWDLALSERPEMELHSVDGNHQSELGAFLTAAVLYGRITGESPVGLSAFLYPAADERDRMFLADVAARTLALERKGDR